MYKTISEALEFTKNLKKVLGNIKGVEVIVCPPFITLSAVARELEKNPIALGAQNMHWAAEGAFTGEISPGMLKEAGCSFVIVGHSERRQYFFESDRMVNIKVKAALAAALIPIVCVGEQLEERENGKTEDVVERQIESSLAELSSEELARVIIAYEPVWAIGTGRNASAQDAQQVNNFLRNRLITRAGEETAQKVRILYGGSVKPDNIADLMAQPDIDGALVGGASLQVQSFAEIIKNACS